MPNDAYLKALKLGQSDYRRHLLRGSYPYLPVLSENIKSETIESEENLGLVQIPAERIVGTYTIGRHNTFAPNFMPLLDGKSEFSEKWSQLYDAHISEGIRDPIKAYEFMNNYYVVEGNKRVSVLKFCKAVTISGEVTRMIPKRTDDPENRLYFEYIDFNRRSGINDIWFSKEGSFDELEKKVTGEPFRKWTDEEQMNFQSVNFRFTEAFKQKGGDKLQITPGDALLAYLDIYPFEETKNKLTDEMKDDLSQIWDEILMLTEEENIELIMDPDKNEKQGLFTRILSPAPQSLKITFINDKTPETSGWTYAHELGRHHLEECFPDRVTTEVINNVKDDGTAEDVIEQAVKDGSNLIFTTTPLLLVPSLKVAIDHPEAHILNCSVNISHRYIRTYYSRLYEAKFLIGMIAGAMSENGHIGYVADYPIFGMTSNINAFALGARMVNPRAKIYLDWSSREGYEEHRFIGDADLSYVSMQDMIVPEKDSHAYGLYSPDSEETLAAPVRDWGKLYELIVTSIFNGKWEEKENTTGNRALNYLWGMSSGVIDVIFSRHLPEGLAHMVGYMKESIKNGTFEPFSGVIRSQDGTIRCDGSTSLTPEEILTMNWLVDNVEGEIPKSQELNDEAKKLVEILGLDETKD